MKTVFKSVTTLFYALLFVVVFGKMLADYFNSPIIFSMLAVICYSILTPKKYLNGTLRAGVYVEVWLKELVEKFRFKREWLSLIPRYDDKAKNQVIHMVDIGADPQVFLNLVIDENNPVPTNARVDSDLPISLDRYDTENTRLSELELRATSYDIMKTTLDLHMNAISDRAALRAAWRLAATAQSNIKTTSGNTDGRAVAKKRLTPDDLVMMTEICTSAVEDGGAGWPEGDGVCVMDYRHVADMQKLDQNFDKQWKNAQTGELFPYNGWKIMKFNHNAKYQQQLDGTFTLNAFGAAADPANDLHSSLFFLPQRAFAAADANPEMFFREASKNPKFRTNTVGFRHWNIIGKKKVDGFYQMVSEKI